MSRPDPVVVTPGVLREWPLPAPGAGKKARGQVLVVGGGAATPGALSLAGTASLRAGAGKLVLATVGSTTAALAVAVPECGVRSLPATEEGEIAPEAADAVAGLTDSADALLVGSGCRDTDAATGLVSGLAPGLDVPLVLDALGSAFLTHQPDGLRHLDGRAVLTVNPTELSRTAGCDEDDVERDPWEVVLAVARRSGVVVVCGGARKHVGAPDGRTWLVEGGGAGLGVSGSGDVQAGIVTGLLARGAEPAQAAVWGAYVHARSGERLAAQVGAVGYLARELPGQVPLVLAELA